MGSVIGDAVRNTATSLRLRIRAVQERLGKGREPWKIAAVAIAIIAVLMIIILILPPYIGLSDDGSFQSVMQDVGLRRLDEKDGSMRTNFYERVYRIDQWIERPNTTPALQRWIIHFAITLDSFFSHDSYFDMRWLAACYCVLYLLTLYPLLRSLLSGSELFTQQLIITLLFVIIFADVSLLARFASLYVQPIELILFLWMTNALLNMTYGKRTGISLIVLLAANFALQTVNQFAAVGAIAFLLLCWLLLLNNHGYIRIAGLICAVGFSAVCVVGIVGMEGKQTLAEKYDQMTRGVLFQAENPQKALAEFGIEPRFSLLTDTYSDQQFPIVFMNNPELKEGFFDHYNMGKVTLYYLKHPEAVVGLFDQAVRQAFVMRSEYSGNYEKEAGRMPRAKTLFMSIWSTFKERSFPKTSGMFLIMVVGGYFLIRRSKRKLSPEEQAAHSQKVWVYAVFAGFVLLQIFAVIVASGDGSYARETFLLGCEMDVMILILVQEMLGRVSALQGRD